MASASNFRTSLRHNNVEDARNVFVNKRIREMISQGRIVFPCNAMKTIQCFFLSIVKQHYENCWMYMQYVI